MKYQSQMIRETQKGKVSSVWMECVMFLPVYFVLEIIKGVMLFVAAFIAIFRTDIVEIAMSGEVSTQAYNRIVAEVIADPLVAATLLLSCVVTVVGVIFFCVKVRNRSLASMGIVKKKAVRKYLLGCLIGAGMLAAVFGLLALNGNVSSIQYNGLSVWLFVFFVGFLMQTASEELLMRGYLMNSISARGGVTLGIVLNTVIFTALHLFNPGMTVLSLFNIALLGVIFSLLFLLTENIWVVSGLHFCWNFLSACFTGSGIGDISFRPVFSIYLTETKSFLGLDIGVAGNDLAAPLVALIVLAVLVVLVARKKKNQVPESRLDDEEQPQPSQESWGELPASISAEI